MELFGQITLLDVSDGEDGKGIGRVEEWYLATSKASGVTHSTTGWTEDVHPLSSAKKYLWNYEISYYTDGTLASKTEPYIIGVYGEDGRGVLSVKEFYLVSDKDKGVTVGGEYAGKWKEEAPAMTPVLKYLWNYEEVTYTDGDSDVLPPAIIGVYGDKGDHGEDGKDAWNVIADPGSITFSMSNNQVSLANNTIVVVAKRGNNEASVSISSVTPNDSQSCTVVKTSNGARITAIKNREVNEQTVPYESGSVTIKGTASYDGDDYPFSIAVPWKVDMSYVWGGIKSDVISVTAEVGSLKTATGKLQEDVGKLEVTSSEISSLVSSRLVGGNNLLADSAFERGSLALNDSAGTAIRTVTAPDFVDLMPSADASAWNGRNYAYINTKMYSGVIWKNLNLTSGTYTFSCKLKITDGFVPDANHNIVLQVKKDGSEILRKDRTDFGLTSGAAWKNFTCSFTVAVGYTYSIVIFVYSTGNLSILSPSLTAGGSNVLDANYTNGIAKTGVREVVNSNNVSLKYDSTYGKYIAINAPKFGGFSWRNLSLKPNTFYRMAFMGMTTGGNVGNLVCQVKMGTAPHYYSMLHNSHTAANGGWQRHTFTFVSPSSGLTDILFYTGDYGTFGISEPMLTEGETEYPWSRGEEDERYMSSKITQTAENIKLEVKDELSRAGMRIAADGITMTAGKTGWESPSHFDENGDLMKYLDITVDDQGFPHIAFLGPDKSKTFDISWKGISDLINNSTAAVMSRLGEWLVTRNSVSVTAAQLDGMSFKPSGTEWHAYRFSAAYTNMNGNLVVSPAGAQYDGQYFAYDGISSGLPSDTTLARNGVYYVRRSGWFMEFENQNTSGTLREYHVEVSIFFFARLSNNKVTDFSVRIYRTVRSDGYSSGVYFKDNSANALPNDATMTLM